MTSASIPGPGLPVLLRLGRVSNLPTVWTNVLAGTVLAGGAAFSGRTALVGVAMTLFYVGGMYLNDACDSAIDARERPDRPIPSGQIALGTVYAAGFAMLGAGVVVLAVAGLAAGMAGVLLAAAIVAYDLHHKGNPWSPLTMGLCRALVIIASALAVRPDLTGPVLLGAVALGAHVVGLTYAARQEALDRVDRLWPLAILAAPLVLTGPAILSQPALALPWLALAAANAMAVLMLVRRRPGAVPAAVALMIAAISLLDALLATVAGVPFVALACAAGFVLTLAAQRFIPGT